MLRRVSLLWHFLDVFLWFHLALGQRGVRFGDGAGMEGEGERSEGWAERECRGVRRRQDPKGNPWWSWDFLPLEIVVPRKSDSRRWPTGVIYTSLEFILSEVVLLRSTPVYWAGRKGLWSKRCKHQWATRSRRVCMLSCVGASWAPVRWGPWEGLAVLQTQGDSPESCVSVCLWFLRPLSLGSGLSRVLLSCLSFFRLLFPFIPGLGLFGIWWLPGALRHLLFDQCKICQTVCSSEEWLSVYDAQGTLRIVVTLRWVCFLPVVLWAGSALLQRPHAVRWHGFWTVCFFCIFWGSRFTV